MTDITKPQSRGRTHLAVALYTRGLTFDDLASASGYATGTLRNLAAGTWQSQRARDKIEAILGERIWPESEGSE